MLCTVGLFTPLACRVETPTAQIRAVHRFPTGKTASQIDQSDAGICDDIHMTFNMTMDHMKMDIMLRTGVRSLELR